MVLAIFGVFEVSGPLLVCHRWLTVQLVKQEKASKRYVQLSKYFTHVPHIQFVQPGMSHPCTNHELGEGVIPYEGNTPTLPVSNTTQLRGSDFTLRQRQQSATNALPNHLIYSDTVISLPQNTTKKCDHLSLHTWEPELSCHLQNS